LTDPFSLIKDPPIDRKKLHSLKAIIVVAICPVIGGCDNFDEMFVFPFHYFSFLIMAESAFLLIIEILPILFAILYHRVEN
jgi:hypothetical protein